MKAQRGFALIEVMIAIALLGIISAAFLGALGTASKAVFTSDERATAESLARSQMENVKNVDYITAAAYDPDVSGTGEVTYAKITEIPDGYTIWSVNRDGAPVGDVIGVPWDSQNNLPVDNDVGLQRIKLIIKHQGNAVLTLEGYKVDR